MIIYISGPMSGLLEMNFPAFAEAATRLRGLGHMVVSPHEVTLPEYPAGYKPVTEAERTAMWLAFMRADIKQMMDADTVVTLPGWAKSKGANIEIDIALGLHMPVVSLRQFLEDQS